MSKELEALKEIGNHKIKYDVNIKYYNGDETHLIFENIRGMFPNQFALIENALKENIKLKNSNNKYRATNKKLRIKEQVLRIIKEKKVDVGWLISCENIEQYNNVIGTATHKLLAQEEFDLLKGWLL